MSGKFFDCGRVRTSTHCTPLLPPQARSAFLEVQPISLSSPRPGRKFEELAGRKFSMDQICKNSLCKLCQSNVSFLNLLEKISINWNNQSKLQNSRSLQLHIYTYERSFAARTKQSPRTLAAKMNFWHPVVCKSV